MAHCNQNLTFEYYTTTLDICHITSWGVRGVTQRGVREGGWKSGAEGRMRWTTKQWEEQEKEFMAEEKNIRLEGDSREEGRCERWEEKRRGWRTKREGMGREQGKIRQKVKWGRGDWRAAGEMNGGQASEGPPLSGHCVCMCAFVGVLNMFGSTRLNVVTEREIEWGQSLESRGRGKKKRKC